MDATLDEIVGTTMVTTCKHEYPGLYTTLAQLVAAGQTKREILQQVGQRTGQTSSIYQMCDYTIDTLTKEQA